MHFYELLRKQENCAYARVASTADTCVVERGYSFKKHLQIKIITISISFDLVQSSLLAGSKIDPIIVIMFAGEIGKIKIRSG